MTNEESQTIAKAIFGWTGSGLAMFFYISPVVPIIKMIKKELEVKNVPGILLTCSFLNCILWGCYGWIKDELQVWVANYTGGAISIIWIIIYWIYFAECKLVPSIIYNFILLNFIFEIGFFCFYFKDYVEVTGYIAMAFNILMYAAPGEKMITVIKTKNKELLPIYSSITGLACSLCWFMYGVYIKTTSMIIPNGIGILCAVMQIGVWLYAYYKSKGGEGTKEVATSTDESKVTSDIKNAAPDPLFNTQGQEEQA